MRVKGLVTQLGAWRLGMAGRLLRIEQPLPHYPVPALGLVFPNPVGLAAGIDRDGRRVAHLHGTGCGFIEVGTVNVGPDTDARGTVDRLAARLAGRRGKAAATGRPRQVLGLSIGTMACEANRGAMAAIARLMDTVWFQVDFFVLNLSRPAGPGRDDRATRSALNGFLHAVRAVQQTSTRRLGVSRPLLVKAALAPATAEPVPLCLEVALAAGYDGAVTAYEHWHNTAAVTDRLALLRSRFAPWPLVAVGGIRTAATAADYLAAGATLVEIHTAAVTRRPAATRRLVADLAERCCPSICRT